MKYHREIPFFFDDARRWWLLDDVAPPGLVERILAGARQQGYEPASVNTMYRDSDRAMYDDKALAGELWGHIQPHVPATLGQYTAVGQDSCCRVPASLVHIRDTSPGFCNGRKSAGPDRS